VVVLDALAGPADPELDRMLGAPRAAELREALHTRAGRWAQEVAPGRAFAAASVADVRRLLAGHDGPVLLAAPDVPGLDAAVAAAALDDLGHGVDVVLGAAHDARPYLVALARPEPELLGLVEASFEDVVAALARRQTPLGMLRAERRLRSVADARALALDPVAPPELVRLLAPPAR
jgi:Uncharacterized protein conserved in bacteria (DUF2064)